MFNASTFSTSVLFGDAPFVGGVMLRYPLPCFNGQFKFQTMTAQNCPHIACSSRCFISLPPKFCVSVGITAVASTWHFYGPFSVNALITPLANQASQIMLNKALGN